MLFPKVSHRAIILVALSDHDLHHCIFFYYLLLSLGFNKKNRSVGHGKQCALVDACVVEEGCSRLEKAIRI